MELSKKTTILFPPDLHERLAVIAQQQGVSLGELVRRACETQYGIEPQGQREAGIATLMPSPGLPQLGSASSAARDRRRGNAPRPSDSQEERSVSRLARSFWSASA